MKPTPIKISSSFCWCSINVMPTANNKVDRRRWMKDKELYLAHTNWGDRVVTPIKVSNTTNDPDKIYLMDAITGTLYDPDSGQCLTSSNIWMEDFEFRKGLDKKLLTAKSLSEV